MRRAFSTAQRIKETTSNTIVPSYGRFDLVLSHGKGAYAWDTDGNKYLDFGGGIAVNSLGHAHPEIVETYATQSAKLVHMSNLYYHESQGALASSLVDRLNPGKVFFSNSGAEANEGMYKLARRHGGQNDGSRFEVITMNNSFHGRTLGGIAATGQEKIKAGFYPMAKGFKHVPFNDLEAAAASIGPETAAIMLEGIQGEGGIVSATPEFLLGLRKLCDDRGLLLMMDGVQCGHFRTGGFQSYQTILKDVPGAEDFTPDVVSMAKSLGGGFPMGAFWVREPYQDLLSAGTHGTTYGGNPLGCTIASKILEIVDRDDLPNNARVQGEYLCRGLQALCDRYPTGALSVRGRGLMLGLEVSDLVFPQGEPAAAASLRVVKELQEEGVLLVPSGTNIVRLLPALNTTQSEADECLDKLETVLGRAGLS